MLATARARLLLANCALVPAPSRLPWAAPPATVTTAPVVDDTDTTDVKYPQPSLLHAYCCEKVKTESPGPAATSVKYCTLGTVVTTPVDTAITRTSPL